MKEHYQRLVDILDSGIENDAINHEFYKVFCQTYYTNGLNESCLSLYNVIVRQDISNRKFEESMTYQNIESEFVYKSLKTNDPVYLEYAKALSNLLKLKLQGKQKNSCATVEYSTIREKLTRKYSALTIAKTDLKLSNKNASEIKKMGKWKSSAIDDLARTLVELSQYPS